VALQRRAAGVAMGDKFSSAGGSVHGAGLKNRQARQGKRGFSGLAQHRLCAREG
jgi:hypothetical protein